MEPLVVLILLPVLIGVAAQMLLRDTIRASAVATVLSPTVVYVCLISLDRRWPSRWRWLPSWSASGARTFASDRAGTAPRAVRARDEAPCGVRRNGLESGRG
jgi:hypothetical protein